MLVICLILGEESKKGSAGMNHVQAWILVIEVGIIAVVTLVQALR